MSREEKLNNPGGIVTSDIKFQGEVASSDTKFKAFATPVMGIRALAKVLLTYYRKHEIHTVEGIINRWAPPVENNTTAYIKDVAGRLKVSPIESIEVDHPDVLTTLVTAIIYHENGEVIYTEQQIEDGVDAALA